MKKALSILTAAALAAGTIGTMTASAHQIDDGRFAYTEANRPYIYMKVDETDGHVKLSDEFIYINREKIPDEGEVIYIEVYIYEATKKLLDNMAVLQEKTSTILMRNGYDPRDVYGSSPFKERNNRDKYTSEDMTPYIPPYGPVNSMVMNYLKTNLYYYKLAGENTDDYPMGCFDMVAPKSIATGIYYVDHPDASNGCKSSALRVNTDENDNYVSSDYFLMDYHCRNLQINVSDRDLGDLNASSDIDNLDAELLLEQHALSMNNTTSLIENLLIASDVNGDRVVDDLDAEMIMDYELLYGMEEQPEVSFTDYVKQQIGEE